MIRDDKFTKYAEVQLKYKNNLLKSNLKLGKHITFKYNNSTSLVFLVNVLWKN